jgi:hypothetical protein
MRVTKREVQPFALAIALLACACSSGDDTSVHDAAQSEDAKSDGGEKIDAGGTTVDAAMIETGTPDVNVSTPDTGPVTDDTAEQKCVDTINQYRATLNLPPYQRWKANESCTDGQALTDSQTGVPHSAFGKCGEYAQNECPGWPGPPAAMIPQCLAMMWAEGPGDFAHHGHYVNMSSTAYTMVSCGFATASNGSIWATQDFK